MILLINEHGYGHTVSEIKKKKKKTVEEPLENFIS